MDHFAIYKTFFDLNSAWTRDAAGLSAYFTSFNKAFQSTIESVSGRLLTAKPQMTANGDDDLLDWVKSMACSSQQYHQMLNQCFTEYVANAPDLDADVRQRALFWGRQILEMLSPSNFFWTNPKAVQRSLKSEGKSLLQGIKHWQADLQRRELPQLTDQASFVVGQNLALSPGTVVYRNHLVEVIQYAAQTPLTWQVPIVLIQPWINKYYIFDLSTNNSFVRYLVQQGFTVFITSWKNPTSQMRDVTFEDYMLQGALQAINVARDICQSEHVHAAGYCIGGTLLAALMGWLAHENKQQPIRDAALFASLLDFNDPGDLKAIVNPASFKLVEQLVAADGVLKRQYLSLAFRSLNPGDLIWRNVVNNYFYGEAPPRSDMLFWNSDGTHLPGAMCTYYIKSFYLENLMIQPNALVLGQRPIDLKKIRLPVYAVGAQKDHICPWQATFQTCHLTRGPVRYVLATEGHITGIVNPPSVWNKKTFWAGTATRWRNADRWLQKQKPASGSWWPDWVAWLQPRSGSKTNPPPLESKRYPPLGTAPGTYVLE